MSVEFRAAHHTDKISRKLCVRTYHITVVYFTPQTLNNFNFNYFVSIHSYPILFLHYYSKVTIFTEIMCF